MIRDKKEYSAFDVSDFPIWCQTSYLDAIVNGGWDCRFITDDHEVSAIWIFGVTKKLGFRSMNFPTFLKYNGPFFAESVEDSLFDELAIQLFQSLPTFVKMSMEFQPGIVKKIPTLMELLHTKAFSKRVRQTYVWDITRTAEELLAAMDGNYRRMINKHSEKYSFHVATRDEASDLFQFHMKWVDDLGNHGVAKKQFRIALDSFYKEGNGGVYELDYEGEKISSALIVKDQEQVYFLLSANNKDYNKVYPSVLMAYEVAKFFKGKGIRKIDFLGSDIDAVARVWRKLGAKRKQYHFMSKNFILPL